MYTEVGPNERAKDIGANFGEKRYFRIRAFNDAGFSCFSNIDSGTTYSSTGIQAPAAPVITSCSTAPDNAITLSWNPSSGVETYTVKRSTFSGGPYVTIANGIHGTSYTTSTMVVGTTYYFVVSAVNSAGHSNSDETSTICRRSLPAAPSDLVAVARNSTNEIDLYWTDNSLAETEFYVEIASSPGVWNRYPETFGENATSAAITNLVSNKMYDFRVVAHNSAGYSEYSNTAFTTTLSSMTKIEAESANLENGTGVNTNHEGYSGWGFVDGFKNDKAQITFSVYNHASTDKNYGVTFHYSAGNGKSTNMWLCVQDGYTYYLDCRGTGNWDTWADVSKTITLKPGYNVLTIKSEDAVNSTVINLDYIMGLEPKFTELDVFAFAEENGSISPNGHIKTIFGEDQIFSITPNYGYKVSDVLVDGDSKGAITSYMFRYVTTNHTISAKFSKIDPCSGVQGGGSGLQGTVFGLSPSWSVGSEYCKATDGDINTFYDYSQADGGYTGLDLGSAKVISKIRYYPRNNSVWRTVGGKFQGSNTSSSDGFVDLYTITATQANAWNEVTISNLTGYRWVRYLSPNGGYGNIAEMEFYESGFFPDPNKWYKIASRTNNLCFDVTSGSYTHSTAIELYPKTNVNQEFKFQNAGNGYYTITCRGNTNYSIDMSGIFTETQTLKLWPTDVNNRNQKFKIIAVGNGNYRLETINQNFSIASDGTLTNTTTPCPWLRASDSFKDSQKWVISEVQ
jgi:hypothetical protein